MYSSRDYEVRGRTRAIFPIDHRRPTVPGTSRWIREGHPLRHSNHEQTINDHLRAIKVPGASYTSACATSSQVLRDIQSSHCTTCFLSRTASQRYWDTEAAAAREALKVWRVWTGSCCGMSHGMSCLCGTDSRDVNAMEGRKLDSYQGRQSGSCMIALGNSAF